MKIVLRDFFALIALLSLLLSSVSQLPKRGNVADITINTSACEKITNIASNANVWDMGTLFFDPQPEAQNNVFEFVRYVQLMQCTGGTAERDLFVDPYDTSTYTDYDFSGLIKNCRGIMSVGAKPHLKLGGVPLKFTSGYEMGGFAMNVYPPDDYTLYYDYIKAVAQSLVDEFGADEVLTWRFGCMTEYENGDWFMAKSGTPEDSAQAFCKLYDYTVQALVDVLGDTVFVGAHSMSVTEGLWGEALLIKHIAEGTNYANGKKGTRVCFLSASFYDSRPGEFTQGKTLPETVEYLRSTAESCGLDNLIYGVDEGRILCGNTRGASDDQLLNRTVGYTWQAAYDARLWKQGIESGLDYFSSWGYLSNGLFSGYPTVSYHVAKNLALFAGSVKTQAKADIKKSYEGVEIDCLSAWDREASVLRIMAYNFKNDPAYDKTAQLNFTIDLPEFDGKTVKITKRTVSDDCNFFDEWQEDRKTYNIGNNSFSWSPDDPCLDNITTLSDAAAREIYFNNLRDG
ncbi:MAG: hypothetical protein GX851_05910, partial [Clostridiales bacterium]|nr:hypothetical protein [Clostridiales bacterium]